MKTCDTCQKPKPDVKQQPDPNGFIYREVCADCAGVRK